MKRYTPHLILMFALLIAGFALFGSDSYSELQMLQSTLEKERKQAQALKSKVNTLRREVSSIQTSNRALDKAARNELALARENEVVVFFDEPATQEERFNEEAGRE